MVQILIRRIYEAPTPADGRRILVDRLWPRGISKQRAQIDFWAREAAPSADLRRWYRHDPEKWREFERRYAAELDANPDAVAELERAIGDGPATLLFSSRETERNNARALAGYLSRRAAIQATND